MQTLASLYENEVNKNEQGDYKCLISSLNWNKKRSRSIFGDLQRRILCGAGKRTFFPFLTEQGATLTDPSHTTKAKFQSSLTYPTHFFVVRRLLLTGPLPPSEQ